MRRILQAAWICGSLIVLCLPERLQAEYRDYTAAESRAIPREPAYASWSGRDLLRMGNALSACNTLIQPVQRVPQTTFVAAAPHSIGAPETRIPRLPLPYSAWSANKFLKAGRALSDGATLAQPLSLIHLPVGMHGTIRPSLAIDLTRFNVGALRENAVSKVGAALLKREILFGISTVSSRGGAVAGGAWATFNAGRGLYNAWRVGTGQVDPTLLRATIPHAVMAWEAMRGPENLPTQTFTTSSYSHYGDAAWSSTRYGTQTVRQDFSSSARGKLGSYGFDPYTDRLIRQTSTYVIQNDRADGGRFNQTYGNRFSSAPNTAAYLHPQIPNSAPLRIPGYTAPQFPAYTPHTYSPPAYIPPRDYNRR